jgi:hypothetical protein
VHGPARVHEGEAIALEALHDEALAAEETGAERSLEGDAEGDALGRAQERILLRDQGRRPPLARFTGTILPG